MVERSAFVEKIRSLMKKFYECDESYKDLLETFQFEEKELAVTFVLNYELFYENEEEYEEYRKRLVDRKDWFKQHKKEIATIKVDALLAWFDGACTVNPSGEMGWGWYIVEKGEIMQEDCGQVDASTENSSNVAEYIGLIGLLQRLVKINPSEVVIHGDSKLVVYQMNGIFGIKEGRYKNYAHKAKALVKKLEKNGCKIIFKWIPREENSYADDLSKKKLTHIVRQH